MMEGKPRTAPARAAFFRNERRLSCDIGVGIGVRAGVALRTGVTGETFRGKEGNEDEQGGLNGGLR
jgi:hypothetical protein